MRLIKWPHSTYVQISPPCPHPTLQDIRSSLDLHILPVVVVGVGEGAHPPPSLFSEAGACRSTPRPRLGHPLRPGAEYPPPGCTVT